MLECDDLFYDTMKKMKRLFLVQTLLTLTLLSSCSAMDSLLATPTPVPLTETPLPTATINWFPASATPTPQPSSANGKASPTPEMQLDLGDVILEDGFSDETLWDIALSDRASSAISNNRLTLSVQSELYLFSLRHELILSDYYVEITAQPGLCKGEDHYGLLIRASSATYYRFALACNGTVRVERYSSGNRLILEGPFLSGDVPPGAPGNVRIGVWAYGKEMRLFLNERFQFSIIDPSFPSGTIGVFVRSEGSTPVVVSFSDLVIQEVKP